MTSGTAPHPGGRALSRAAVAVSVAVYVAAAALCRPVGVTVRDEVDNFSEAAAVAAGAPLNDAASYRPANNRPPFTGPRYPLGWPAVLAPFLRLPWPAPYAAGVLLHLGGALGFVAAWFTRGPPRLALVVGACFVFGAVMTGARLVPVVTPAAGR